MSSRLLIDYRCMCGKLLLKGLLCQGFAEVKCRRCGVVSVFTSDALSKWSLIESNAEGTLIEASGAVEYTFGEVQKHLLERTVTQVIPLLHDALVVSGEQSYKLTDTTLILKDGSSRDVEVCILPKAEKGTFSGYRIYAILN